MEQLNMSSPNKGSESGLDPSVFDCGICRDMQHKPCVNACGHSFCFWCLHLAMGYLNTTHACPLCRAPFRHFPAVCAPLHSHLARRFPTEMEAREEETIARERDEFLSDSPSVPTALGGDDGALDVRRAFTCVECGGPAVPPTVLTCGHVVCRGTGGRLRRRRECPIDGCFGRMASSAPATCAVIDVILRDGLSPEEYREAAEVSVQTCGGMDVEDDAAGPATSVSDGGSNASASSSFAPNDSVAIGGLTRPRAEQSSSQEETYVHFGVGCDGCGVYPIIGRRYKCKDCSEEIGFDLCGDCLDDGMHKREAASVGRFNQQHRPEHRMEEVEQVHTYLHEIQRRNPNIPLSQLVEMIDT